MASNCNRGRILCVRLSNYGWFTRITSNMRLARKASVRKNLLRKPKVPLLLRRKKYFLRKNLASQHFPSGFRFPLPSCQLPFCLRLVLTILEVTEDRIHQDSFVFEVNPNTCKLLVIHSCSRRTQSQEDRNIITINDNFSLLRTITIVEIWEP